MCKLLGEQEHELAVCHIKRNHLHFKILRHVPCSGASSQSGFENQYVAIDDIDITNDCQFWVKHLVIIVYKVAARLSSSHFLPFDLPEVTCSILIII